MVNHKGISCTYGKCAGVAVKTVRVRYAQRETVLVSGRPFGIKMSTEGLMVVGFTDFSTDGRRMNPARSAGLSTGDILLSIDGISLTSNEQMGALVQGGGGRRPLLHFADRAVDADGTTVWQYTPQFIEVAGGESVFAPIRDGMVRMAQGSSVLRQVVVPCAAKTGSPQLAVQKPGGG